MRRFLFAVFLVVACATVASANSFDDAMSAHARGDDTLAVERFHSLAEQGDAAAQYNLGQLYRMGQGVPPDAQEAERWYRKAAAQGIVDAQFNLGLMYGGGQGVPQDYQEAVKWYRKAAAQGNAVAQLNLGVMYSKGQGVLQDYLRAHMWYNVAAAALSGDEGKEAMKFRDSVASQMTAAQIEKAQEMARRCQDTKFKECN